MKQLIAAMICTLFALTSAHAADKAEAKKAAPAVEKAKKEPSEAQKKQQVRMKDCNAKAEGKAGDDRKKYMSSCLKGESASATSEKKTAQQEKMKSCNKEAGDKKMKGDERKKFMSSCLKG